MPGEGSLNEVRSLCTPLTHEMNQESKVWRYEGVSSVLINSLSSFFLVKLAYFPYFSNY